MSERIEELGRALSAKRCRGSVHNNAASVHDRHHQKHSDSDACGDQETNNYLPRVHEGSIPPS